MRKSITTGDQVRLLVLGLSIALMLIQSFRQVRRGLTLEAGFLTVDYSLINPVKYFLLIAFIAFFAILGILNRNAKAGEPLKPLGAPSIAFGLISFVPVIGIPFGILSMLFGLNTWRPGGKKLAALGAGGLLVMTVLFAVLFVMFKKQFPENQF